MNKKTEPIKSNVIKKNTVDFKNMEKEKKPRTPPPKNQHHTVGTVPKSKIVETEAKSIPLTDHLLLCLGTGTSIHKVSGLSLFHGSKTPLLVKLCGYASVLNM